MHKEDVAEVWAPQGLSVDVKGTTEVWKVGDPEESSCGPQSPAGFHPSDTPRAKQESPAEGGTLHLEPGPPQAPGCKSHCGSLT